MNKAYSRINWQNKTESLETPLNANNLNRIDLALNTIDDRVVIFDTSKANQSDLLGLLTDITYNTATGVFVFTWKNGRKLEVDLNIEKIPVSFEMSVDGVITMTTSDGTKYTCDLKTIIKEYSFEDTNEILINVDTSTGKSVVTATIAAGAVTEDKLEPNYKAEMELLVDESEAWAKGTKDGQSVEETDPTYHNNSKYYSEQSKDYRNQTQGIREDAEQIKDYIQDAIGISDFILDANGNLVYEDNAVYVFTVDDDGMLNYEVRV